MTNKNEFKRIIFAIACLTLVAAKTNGQELNVWANGGWQGLSYKIQDGYANIQADGSLGLGYTFPLWRHWGLVTGITGGFFNTKSTLENGTYSFNEVDNTGTAFRYDINAIDYRETQRFFTFGVPLMLQFHTTGSRTQWYINGGGKLLLPSNATIKSSAQQLTLSGYYPDYNLEISDLPEHGLGTLQNWQGSKTYKLKTGAALDAETGISFKLSAHVRLYAGLYIEYGLSDIRNDNAVAPLVGYNPNGITDVQGGTVLNLAKTSTPRALSYGLMIKFGFGHGGHKPVDRHNAQAPAPAKVPASALGTAQAHASAPVPDTAQNKPTSEQAKQGVSEPVGASQKQESLQTPQKQEPETVQASQKPSLSSITPEEIRTVQEQVVFGILGKTDLAGSQKPHLDEVAAILNKYPDIRILITGHTCSIGTKVENSRVGEARAQAVADYLQKKGIDRGRMDIRSVGESNPVAPNNSPENRSRNRRVTILYLSASPN